MKWLTLSRAQQLYVAIVILLVLPVILGFTLQHELNDLYLEQFVRPGLEKQFGFRAGRIRVPETSSYTEQFAVVTVSPDGVLGRAGVRAGDLPVGYKHGFATGFYQDLLELRRGHAVEIFVLSAEDYGKDSQAWRKVRIEPASAK